MHDSNSSLLKLGKIQAQLNSSSNHTIYSTFSITMSQNTCFVLSYEGIVKRLNSLII